MGDNKWKGLRYFITVNDTDVYVNVTDDELTLYIKDNNRYEQFTIPSLEYELLDDQYFYFNNLQPHIQAKVNAVIEELKRPHVTDKYGGFCQFELKDGYYMKLVEIVYDDLPMIIEYVKNKIEIRKKKRGIAMKDYIFKELLLEDAMGFIIEGNVSNLYYKLKGSEELTFSKVEDKDWDLGTGKGLETQTPRTPNTYNKPLKVTDVNFYIKEEIKV